METADQKLAWMIVLATIPVGLVGLVADHETRVLFAKPVLAGVFLVVNGAILYAGERFRTARSRQADAAARDEELAASQGGGQGASHHGPSHHGRAAHASGHRAVRQQEVSAAIRSDERLASLGYVQGTLIGTAQVLALLAGISRDGIVMVGGMYRGLSREDAARFSFLLSAPVILAAGVFKLPTLMGPEGNGIRGQVLAGSILSGIGAYLALRFLIKYFQTRTLTPFAIYCTVAGLGSLAYLTLT